MPEAVDIDVQARKRATGLPKWQDGQTQLREHSEQFLFSSRGWTDGLESSRSAALGTKCFLSQKSH